MSTVKDKILDNLKTVIAGVYETESSEVDTHVTFLEMGMDSISIIQVKQLVKKSYGFDVPVDRLFDDIANLDMLADFIAGKMPMAAVFPEPVSLVAEVPQPSGKISKEPVATFKQEKFSAVTPIVKRTSGNVSAGIQQIINEQLQVMQRQMEILSAMGQQ
jgi:iturin family lipopeptide synthetase A